MARRSQCSSAGDNPLDPNYLPPHYREEYRLAVDALVESGLDGYYEFLQKVDVVDFLSTSELQYIQSCVQTPRQSGHPEQQQHFLDVGGDGSSDTYWPVHSDLEVPGLDLGWPQMHAFMEPTEVTTLVNPPEPDMPSIKEQARRLIKNAQQVVAVAMDVFTDVDMFADILNAAARRVAVYVLLDEQNAHHFVNMVANCRVDLDNFQFLRVRTVSGIAYRCRSGRSFKGQMMDRFLLTDCRAVLSGNYSFMWSFEKLHRCMAHLFLGQLVTTFDEEFRILFAQSQPLIVEKVLAPMEDLNVLQQKQYFNDNAALRRDPRKFLSLDSGHPDEWGRHSYDERMDDNWRMTALKRQDTLRGPADVYNRFTPQQTRMDPGFDQGPSRMLMTENPAFKRHSFAEGVHSRHSMPFMQGMPESEPKGNVYHRGQQPYPGPAPESEYSAYDRFWNQDYLPTDQYPEPYLPQEVPPPDNFDPVLSYLSSTRNVDYDQSSEKFPPAADLLYVSPRSKRRGLAQPHAYQTSPTPSNSAEQKQFLQDPAVSRKDPAVKQGLRNWRINSYLSAYDDPEEESLPLVPPQGTDAFEEPPRPALQTAPGMDLSVPKIPYVKEFKVPAMPRPSQMPSYAKATPQERPKMYLDEHAPAAVEIKVTPTPSESSTEGEKTKETEQKEPKASLLTREDSFRRQYNTATQRSSRLRSSLIFSSLESQQPPQETADQPDEESEKNKTEQIKLPFASHVSRQRKSAAREPFEWSRFIKSTAETSKAEDKGSSKEGEPKDPSDNPEPKETLKQPDVESPSMDRSKSSEAEPSRTDPSVQPTKPFLTAPLFVDMSDADQRFMFFKELAAKRKAAEAAKAEKKKDKAEAKPQVDLKNSLSFQKQEPLPKVASISEGLAQTVAESSGKTCEPASVDVCGNTSRKNSLVSSDVNTSTFSGQETKPFNSEKTKFDKPSVLDLHVSAEPGACQDKPKEEQTESMSFLKGSPSSFLARSMSFEAKLPQTDQLAEPSKPSPAGRLHGDVNNPYKRLMYFKQLAAKQKADEAAKDKSEIKPQVDLKTSLVFQKEEALPKIPPESVRSSIAEGLLKDTPVVESSGNVVSTETSESASLSFHSGNNTSRKNSVVNSDPSTSDACTGQENKPLDSGKTKLDKPSRASLPVSAETDVHQRTSLEQTESASSDKDSSSSSTRFMSSEAELPKTDLLVEPTKPTPPAPKPVDASNPYRRFLYFKELAGARKADEATKAEKAKAEIKPEATTLLNVASETEALLKKGRVVEGSEVMSTRTLESDSSDACSEQETKLSVTSENTDRQSVSDLSGMPCQNKSFEEETTSSSFVKRAAPFLARSKSTEAALPKTDQLVQPTKPSPAPLLVDMSDTEKRFTYFKELAAKRKAALAEKEWNKAEEKRQVDLRSRSLLLKEELLPDAPSKSTNASTSEVNAAVSEGSGDTVSSEASQSVSLSLATKKDHASPTCGDQETKHLASEETGQQSLGSLPVPAQTEARLKTVPEEPSVPDPVVAGNSQIAAAPVHVSSPGTDETENVTPESTSEESRSVDSSSSPGLHAHLQHPESSQSQTKTVSLLPSEQNTGSDTSDEALIISGSQNSSPLTEETSDVCPEPSKVDETKAQEPVESSLQESSHISNETPPKPGVETGLDHVPTSGSCQPTSLQLDGLNTETGLDHVPQSSDDSLQKSDRPNNKTALNFVSTENPSADESSNVGTGPKPNLFPSPTSCEEVSAAAPSAEGAELGKEEREAPGSSGDIKSDATFGPESGLLSEPESSFSRPDVNKEVDVRRTSLEAPSDRLTSETGSVKQAAPSHDLGLTGFDAPGPAETVSSEPERSLETIKTETNVSAVDLNLKGSAPMVSGLPEPALDARSEADMTCEPGEPDKTSQTSKEPEPLEPTELQSVNMEQRNSEDQNDKDSGTQDSVSSDQTNEQTKQNSSTGPTDATSKQPKLSPSRYNSSTANVLSSSNLRDDTKLLLGKISANCQSRNDANREPAVTDDEKEDENAKKEKDGRCRTSDKEQAKPNPEREKVLEKFESMRKEKRVYSRFMF
ncbi:protein FAM83H [Nematolebias whitei]|uniref:protein FAM83H n=1 Tax=Nematolebias whitei TaxID=451745 RepID=UPI00189A2B8F|nr:protein FAM83H [Nematolebias whitei]